MARFSPSRTRMCHQPKQTVFHMFYSANRSLWEGNYIRNIETAQMLQLPRPSKWHQCEMFFSLGFQIQVWLSFLGSLRSHYFIYFLWISMSPRNRTQAGLLWDLEFHSYASISVPHMYHMLWSVQFFPFRCTGNPRAIVICDIIPGGICASLYSPKRHLLKPKQYFVVKTSYVYAICLSQSWRKCRRKRTRGTISHKRGTLGDSVDSTHEKLVVQSLMSYSCRA